MIINCIWGVLIPFKKENIEASSEPPLLSYINNLGVKFHDV